LGKKESRKKPLVMSWHHRKKVADGGDRSKRNMSYIPQTRHWEWNDLAGNGTTRQIASRLNYPLRRKGFCVRLYININGEKKRVKLEPFFPKNYQAGKTLCEYFDKFLGSINTRKKIEIINNVYLDPDYSLDIRKLKAHKYKFETPVSRKTKTNCSRVKTKAKRAGLSLRK
jgi:hypothetical protein